MRTHRHFSAWNVPRAVKAVKMAHLASSLLTGSSGLSYLSYNVSLLDACQLWSSSPTSTKRSRYEILGDLQLNSIWVSTMPPSRLSKLYTLWRKWEFQVKGGPLGILTLLRITLFPTACALRWLHLHNHQNEKSQVPSFSFLGGESSQSCSSQNHYPWSIFHLQHSKYFLILLVKKQKIDGRVRPKIKRLFFALFSFQTIILYPTPNIVTCTLRIWLREIGFALAYGALMLKTWR